ncbi:MAG: hypothetical protein GTN82_04770 [Candidatus Aminicenantes bacterium]|nr:hypothetical protein [Candidatus Aminicenantes bacterium]NIQ65890.1 hypothetical protein [Candidatus Aminicenantes bacterium]NIR04718.1 hypothetical protein [Candidatus Aminicenantes bacterium]NIT21877.1 hypothetical protein [Candidatus Aminicenantes bacterium]
MVKALCDKPMSISRFNEKKQLYHLVDENIEFIKQQLKDIIKIVENKIGKKLFIFAEGLDKFDPFSPEYISLLDLLNFLNKYKTLYEANLIHLFVTLQKWHNSKKILLTGSSNDKIAEILMKRLGVYSKSREKIIPLLAAFSGGNARQGLRLLMEYDYAVGEIGKDTKEAMTYACQRVRDDLLSISPGSFEPELLKVVDRDKYITIGTIKDFGNRGGSQNAIYQNWILIADEADRELKWPAAVNPLLLPAIEAFKDIPESPEVKNLREWAESHETSPFGLEIDVSETGQKKYFDILSNSEVSFMHLTILEIFGNMAAYFLNPERKDKIIIAYENKELAQLANDFIIGKAGTYNAGNFKDINYDEIPEGRLDFFLSTFQEGQYDGYSIFFKKKLSKPELIALDQRRDAFIDYKMIWWIPYNDLKGYINYWPQLRQFYNIFRLEEDVLSNISIEEIEEDLEDIEALTPSEDPSNGQLKERLHKVLHYLKARKDEQ